MPPTLEARSYCSIYAFGNHICVDNVEEHLTTSYYGIITTFEQVISRPNDQKLVVANLHYLGWVEIFLKLNYGILNIVMLLCNWVKTNCSGNSVTIKWDEYDFTFVNFGSLIPIFPLHIEQVFFSSCDSRERGWKLVLRKNPYKRWITKNIQIDLVEFDMFKVGNVYGYLGL
jgi:hypothetical protein